MAPAEGDEEVVMILISEWPGDLDIGGSEGSITSMVVTKYPKEPLGVES
jgi:hypothetical protein